MISTTYFVGALSKANTAIAQNKNLNSKDVIAIAAKEAFQELVNMSENTLCAHASRAGFLNQHPIPTLTMKENIIVFACSVVIKDAFQLFGKSDFNESIIQQVWENHRFEPNKKAPAKAIDFGGNTYKTSSEMAAEAEDGCAGGACKI